MYGIINRVRLRLNMTTGGQWQLKKCVCVCFKGRDYYKAEREVKKNVYTSFIPTLNSLQLVAFIPGAFLTINQPSVMTS